MIPIALVHFGSETERLVLEVLRSGRVAQGPMVERLEEEFSNLAETSHAVAVSSGTTALVAAIKALGIGRGDEVVTTPFTFAATLNAILESGATAVFADVRIEDALIDTEALESAITSATAALLPVHLYGQMVDMQRIGEVAVRHGLGVIEDACQAVGARSKSGPAGSFGLGCFSLYATKNLTTGEGGVITTNDERVADRLRLLRNQGMRERYQYEVPGHNYRMTDLQAALAVSQFPGLASATQARRHTAAVLTEGLSGVRGIEVLRNDPDRGNVFHQFTIRVTAEARVDRDTLAEQLRAKGVGTGIYYPRAVYDYDCYRSHPQVRLAPAPTAERLANEVLSLPVHPGVSGDDATHIVMMTREILGA